MVATDDYDVPMTCQLKTEDGYLRGEDLGRVDETDKGRVDDKAYTTDISQRNLFSADENDPVVYVGLLGVYFLHGDHMEFDAICGIKKSVKIVV